MAGKGSDGFVYTSIVGRTDVWRRGETMNGSTLRKQQTSSREGQGNEQGYSPTYEEKKTAA